MLGIKIYKKKPALPAAKSATKGIRYNPLANLDEIGYLDDIDIIDPVEVEIEGSVISPFYSPKINGLEEIYNTLLEFVNIEGDISSEIIYKFVDLFNDFTDDIIADGNEKLTAIVDYLAFAIDSLNNATDWYEASGKASSAGGKEYYKNLFSQSLNAGFSAIERVLEELEREIFVS